MRRKIHVVISPHHHLGSLVYYLLYLIQIRPALNGIVLTNTAIWLSGRQLDEMINSTPASLREI